MTLGPDVQTRERAEQELRTCSRTCAAGSGGHRTPTPAPEPAKDPTFHEFASEWFEANEGAWRPNDTRGLRMAAHRTICCRSSRSHQLSQITIAEVDRYRAAKVREGVLSATSINKTITRLAQILEVAVEYELSTGTRRRGSAGA